VINLIAAVDSERGLGDGSGIPWQGRVPSDSAYFRDRTATGLIVMGYRTYEEFAAPLHDRTNYVLTREGSALREGFEPVTRLDGFLAGHRDETVWVVGGGSLYAASIDLADQLYLTQLDADFHCTTFFPEYADRFTLSSSSAPLMEGGISFEFQVWGRSDHPVRPPAAS
jgi:dihydrofolate reductase